MIQVRDIGVGSEPFNFDQRLSSVAAMLADYARFGFHLVEIDANWTGVIFGGRLHAERAARLASVLRGSGLRCSVHGVERVNLAYDPRRDLVFDIMRAQIELCRMLEARTLVIHSGLQALDDVRHGVRPTLLSDAELAEGAAREVAALRALAPLAADAGVTIAVENGDPHLWEYNVLRRFGRPDADLARHHARLLIPAVTRQLEAVDHPNVRLTLDVAHLYLAACALGFDYLEAVEQAAPWAAHLHVNDNFGQLDRGQDEERQRWAFGEADIHLVPGWGQIPLREVFARLPDYTGDLILEIKPSFYDDLPEALANTQALLSAANAPAKEVRPDPPSR